MLMVAAGCAPSLDPDQTRICRTALPALSPAGEQVEIVRIGRGPGPRSVRIDYRGAADGGPPKNRHAICTFSDPLRSGEGADLAGITTERGPVAGATLYLLKRYYLDTPEAAAAAPRPADRSGLPVPAHGPMRVQIL